MAQPHRVSFYIDGFNLYYGSLKPDANLRWLDLAEMAHMLRPRCVTSTRYFTARVKGNAGKRQKLYLAALATRPTVSVHYGRFRTHAVLMPLVNPPANGPRMAQVRKTEEKGSDVNLGTYLLTDGIDGLYDEAVVITNDSDLVEPVAQAKRRFAPVHILSPHPIHVAELAQVATSYGRLPVGVLRQAQMPDSVLLPSGRSVSRPPSWR